MENVNIALTYFFYVYSTDFEINLRHMVCFWKTQNLFLKKARTDQLQYLDLDSLGRHLICYNLKNLINNEMI